MKAMCDAHYTLIHSDFSFFLSFFAFCTSIVVSSHRSVQLHPGTLTLPHLCFLTALLK